jgi:molybdenum cofactor cytidylyltransferase
VSAPGWDGVARRSGTAPATAGLVLAAGAGTRFGPEGKLLSKLDGRPVLEWSVAASCAVRELAKVVVVVGFRAQDVLGRVDFGRAEPVLCEGWADGQSASLRCGLAALAGCERVIVTLGDQPRMTPRVISLFLDQPGGTRAVYAGRPGHPVVLGPDEVTAVLSVDGDVGARDLLHGGPVIEVGHLCSGRDVDTPEDLEALRHEARAII